MSHVHIAAESKITTASWVGERLSNGGCVTTDCRLAIDTDNETCSGVTTISRPRNRANTIFALARRRRSPSSSPFNSAYHFCADHVGLNFFFLANREKISAANHTRKHLPANERELYYGFVWKRLTVMALSIHVFSVADSIEPKFHSDA